jgi:hypothetical protein
MKTEIKANDLRVGNYVTDEFYQHFKTIIKVDSVNEKGINLAIEDDGNYPECASRWIEPEYTFDKLRGIELTEELLLTKCGFSKPDKKDEFGGLLSPELPNGNRIRLVNLEWRTNHFSVKFETLHHLQNWWYDNFQSELTIKFE